MEGFICSAKIKTSRKRKRKTNGKAGHSEENYNVLYDNLAFPEVYAIEQNKAIPRKQTKSR